MVRVGLWGSFDAEDLGEMLLPRVLRRELGARLADVSVRTWTVGRGEGPNRFQDPRQDRPAPLGPWSSSRADELSVASDLLVIDGDLSEAQGFVVNGVGAIHEPDLPTAWHAARLLDEPDGVTSDALRDALVLRAYVSVADERTAQSFAALVDREVVVVPGHALLADRLIRPDQVEDRITRMRLAGVLPDDDLLVVQGGDALLPDVDAIATQVGSLCRERDLVPVLVATTPQDERFVAALADRLPDARRMPDSTGLDDLCAIVAWSAGSIGSSTDLGLVAASFGRPALLIDDGLPGEDGRLPVASIADAFAGATPERVDHLRERLDAHFDRIAALASRPAPVDPTERKTRSLMARLAEREAFAAYRERELEAMIARLNRRITEDDTRFTALWRKIRECDKHYAWQFNRAETAEARVAELMREVERLTGHPPGSWSRRLYLGVRRRVGRLLRRLGLRRSPTPPAEPRGDADA